MSTDWLKLRTWQGSQQTAFEKLCVLLFAHEQVPQGSTFIPKGSPDAGVEAYWILPGGDEWGLQAKFFLTALKGSQWSQIQQSLYSAVQRHPRLIKYTICIPQDRGDPRLDNQSWFMDKWSEHVVTWTKYAQGLGVQLELDYWGETELLDRLTRSEHRGKLLFWLDAKLLTIDWLKTRIDETVANVGPRYTPALNVKLPIVSVFDALGHSSEFFDLFQQHRVKINKEFRRTHLGQARKEVATEWTALDGGTGDVLSALDSIGDARLTRETFDSLSDLGSRAREVAWNCIAGIRDYEAAKAKKSQATSRERMFSYEEHHLRDLADELDTLAAFCHSDDASAVSTRAALLVGGAGTGKTHLLSDVALRRIARGQPTFFFLGGQFEDKEPIAQIADAITGLNTSRDDFLAAADAAGEAAGATCLILIDAINEGDGCLLWMKYMAGMLQVLKGYPHIAIALSVRDTYEDVVVPPNLEDSLTRVLHTGFSGHEYIATKTFFEHFKLKAPSIPLLNPEFDNPQFLKLFCENLVNLGHTEVPRGLTGLTEVFFGFLDSVNQKLASPELLDFDKKDKLVHRAVDRLVDRMAIRRAHQVPRNEAKQLVNDLLPNRTESSSLFRRLLNEGVFYENRGYSAVAGTLVDVVQFSFERFTDHLVARQVLEKYRDVSELTAAFTAGGSLSSLISDDSAAARNRGLLEALSVQVPERFRRELIGVVPEAGDRRAAVVGFLESLIWRDTKAFTEETLATANGLLKKYPGFESHLFHRLLLVSASPEHPWNADFLHRNLMRRPMVQRDATWSIFVYKQFGEHGSIDRLIEWAWSDQDKSHLDDDSVELAAVALIWFLSSSHRFARDESTKALVALLNKRLHLVTKLLNRFRAVDDMYVLERLFAVAYGSILLSDQKDGICDIAEATFDIVFSSGKAIPHILLRDYARGVIDVAVRWGCKLGFDPRRAGPPYASDWSEPTFKEGELESWEKWSADMPQREWARVHLHHSIMGEEDFARYVIGTNSGSFEWSPRPLVRTKPTRRLRLDRYSAENQFDLRIAQRWIMRRVIDLGWTTEMFGDFDRSSVFGRTDREARKPERIGKKYQWIAYHEFLARVSDNFEFLSDHWDKRDEAYDGPWQVGFIRDIDPSCLIKQMATDSDASCWWQPTVYDAWDAEPSDKDWVRRGADLHDPRASIQVVDQKGVEWLVLESYFSFDQPRVDDDFLNRLPRRHVWYQIRSYFVRQRRLKTFFEWAKQQDFMGRWMPESHEAHSLFLGEYYDSPAYRYLQQPYFQREIWSQSGRGSKTLPAVVAPTTDGYSQSSGYDCSIEDTINILLPSEILVRGLSLRWNGRPGEYVDGSGTLVVQGPSVYSIGPNAVVIRKDALLRFLQGQNLGIVWTVLGRKTVLADRSTDWVGGLETSGAYTLENGALNGNLNRKFVGRPGGAQPS